MPFPNIADIRTSPWDGVVYSLCSNNVKRNYQARNFMKAMKAGDKAFFYHSNCKVPGIAGFCRVDGIECTIPQWKEVR